MASVAPNINATLTKMRQAGKLQSYKEKGNSGEKAVYDIIHNYRAMRGGLLYQSFMYPYASDRQGKIYLGNIFYDKDRKVFYDQTTQVNDEIDILYISPFRVFAIEVKAYHMRKVEFSDQWMVREGAMVEKSPLAQAEKHARHLYHSIYDVLPDGDWRYILPCVVFVDAVKSGEDKRSPNMRQYLPVLPLNDLMQTIRSRDLIPPGASYTLDLDAIEKKLKSIQCERTIE